MFGGSTETGAPAGAGFHVNGASDTVFSIQPGLEIGRQLRFDTVSIWRPFMRAGITWQDTGRFSFDASVIGNPQVSAIATRFDQTLAELSAGVDVINATGAVLRLQYDGRFGENTQQNSVSVKGSAPF